MFMTQKKSAANYFSFLNSLNADKLSLNTELWTPSKNFLNILNNTPKWTI